MWHITSDKKQVIYVSTFCIIFAIGATFETHWEILWLLYAGFLSWDSKTTKSIYTIKLLMTQTQEGQTMSPEGSL